MADYSTANSNAQSALNNAADGFVEEYEITNRGRRVKRGKVADQVQAALLLEGIATRRSSGSLFKLAKRKNPS